MGMPLVERSWSDECAGTALEGTKALKACRCADPESAGGLLLTGVATEAMQSGIG
jgi:hypothetical protein